MKNINIKLALIGLLLFQTLQSYSQKKVVTPNEAVKIALENNYGIKLANNQLDLAKNNSSILNSGYLPTVTGNAGATYNIDDTEAQLSNGDVRILDAAESSRYNASININYVLFDGLGRSYNYKQLKEQYKLTELQARETIENTISQLFTVYYNVAQLTENIDALNETLMISENRLLRAKYQFEYGQSTKLAILNAEVDINNDSINLINAKQQLVNFKRDLNVVLGNALENDFSVDTSIKFAGLLNKEELFEGAVTRNNLLLQTEKNIDISNLLIKSGKSGFLPTIGLNGNYGWNENNNNAAAFVSVSTTTGLSGGLNLTWNLFDGGATINRVKTAKINLENQELQKEQILINIERDFNNAWDNYQNRLSVYKIQEENILTAQNNFERTSEKFKLGQVNSIEFRQAQLNLINIELNRNQAKYLAKLAELDLLQISGELLNIDF